MPSAPQPNHDPRISRETLHSLLVDDACGQLAADAAELLHAWLACHPEDAREAEGIRAAVSLAGRACRAARALTATAAGAPAATRDSTAVAGGDRMSLPEPARREPQRTRVASLVGALAASLAVVAALTWRPQQPEPAPKSEPAAVAPIQWTRYVVATDQSDRYTFKPVSTGATP
jgi:hypothetical protein